VLSDAKTDRGRNLTASVKMGLLIVPQVNTLTRIRAVDCERDYCNDSTGRASMAEPFIPIAAAARSTGIPYHTLRRLIASGRMPSVRFAGIRRVRLSQIVAAIEELGVGA
jgi:excisionase family DNA binding protein